MPRPIHAFVLKPAATLIQALLLSLLPHALAQAYCDEPATPGAPMRGLPDSNTIGLSELFDGPAMGNSMEQLASLAREALAGSAEVRGAESATRATGYDLEQTQAGGRPVVTVGGTAGLGQSRTQGSSQSRGVGAVGGVQLSVGAPLWDGGRLDANTEYRRRLLDAGGAGLNSTRERIVSDAVASAIERNRFRLQVRVYQQYASKLSCLVQSLEKIVAQDRGRASELVQARKSQRQAEIQREEAVSALRQADVRLRKLVGNNVSPWGAVGVPLLAVPDLNAVVEEINNSPDVRQLKLQADAAESLAQASRAEGKPRVNWQVGSNATRTAQANSAGWNAGLTLSYTLDDGGAVSAAANAALERARAARRQQEAVVNERVKQASTLHLVARTAYQRARSYAEVLKDSDMVRNYTFEQWSKLGRRSLFDLMSAEAEHYQLRISYVNAVHDGFSASAQLRTSGAGLLPWIAPELGAPERP